EAIASDKYRILSEMNLHLAGEARYLVETAAPPVHQAILSFYHHPHALGPETVARQQGIGRRMLATDSPCLCKIYDFEANPQYQYLVWEQPGEFSVWEILKSRRKVSAAELEFVLYEVIDGLQAAVESRWPKVAVGSRYLFVSEYQGSLANKPIRLEAPAIPTFEDDTESASAENPFQTIAFNPDTTAPGGERDFPTSTRGYIEPVAILCCELLGQPLRGFGEARRFRPIPDLNARQNDVLHEVLDHEGEHSFEGVADFLAAFVREPREASGATTRGRQPTTRPPHTPSPSFLPAPAATPVPASPADPVPAPPALALDPPLAPETLPPPETTLLANPITESAIADGEFRLASPFLDTPAKSLRLRLIPDLETLPIYGVVAEPELRIGRSPQHSDFVTQFRPRTEMNDSRSMKISRFHLSVSLQDNAIVVADRAAKNPSTISGRVLNGPTPLGGTRQVNIASEYPLVFHRFPSAYREPRVFTGIEDATDSLEGPHGAVVISPTEKNILPCRALWIFSDAAFLYTTSGQIEFVDPASGGADGRLHAFADGLWIEVLEDARCEIWVEQTHLKPHEIAPLHEGQRLIIGTVSYRVQ
ncbi:MAG: FHA domain-containing protein, partial [Verrucomicrobiales bacterium]